MSLNFDTMVIFTTAYYNLQSTRLSDFTGDWARRVRWRSAPPSRRRRFYQSVRSMVSTWKFSDGDSGRNSRQLGGEGFVIGGVFAGDDEGGGVEAVFESVEAGGGLALGGAGSGGLLRVGAICVNLSWGCHDYDLAREFWGIWGVGRQVIEEKGEKEKVFESMLKVSSTVTSTDVAHQRLRSRCPTGRAEERLAYARRRISARASASAVLARSVSRLSCSFLPLATAISHLMRPFFR